MRILIGSPVRQKPSILRLFLESLHQLSAGSATLEFIFIDDNMEEESRELLRRFHSAYADRAALLSANSLAEPPGDYRDHHWNDMLIWKVARFKNHIIEHALTRNVDALFLIDSDVLLYPRTLEKLIESGKSIISEIFWTSWQPNAIPFPQVWVCDEYTLFERNPNETLTREQEWLRQQQFLGQLRIPGVYEVGGLGACTLIRRDALQKGVNFSKIGNVSFWGEDRHFCIRAQALGISLHVDTHHPAFHVYRDSDVPEAEAWVKSHRKEGKPAPVFQETSDLENGGFPAVAPERPKLTLSMIVRNEADKFLGVVLARHREYIDEAVIVDDGSSDDSVEICREMLRGIPLHLVSNKESRFQNEVELRKQQWEETLRKHPEWILAMDADEMFEESFAAAVGSVLRQAKGDVGCFRLYDMWSDSHYREDDYWRSHFVYRPMLVRYREGFPYRWKEQPLHCGRFPDNIFEQPSFMLPFRVKHLGWSTPEIRLQKYERYMRLDPDGRYGWKQQYESILDAAPRLVPW